MVVVRPGTERRNLANFSDDVLHSVPRDHRIRGRAKSLSEVPLIEIEVGYWQRAGMLRAKVLAKQRKARLGDAPIAQTCIDARIPLLTRDRDFRAFTHSAGLDLMFTKT